MSILFSLFLKLSAFSLIAFGGINALLPSLLELSVYQEKWIDLQTFADYFAIAQAAPGPNFMTVTLVGWHVGGVVGALLATVAIAWPSSILVYFVQRLILGMNDEQKKKAIQYAAAALAVGLVLTSSWELARSFNSHWTATLLTIVVMIVTVFSKKIHPLYLITLGAIVGGAGFI
jgi:chromate transporter